jgi:hypothetical protein
MPLFRRILLILAAVSGLTLASASDPFPPDYHRLDAPQHQYWERTPRDRFSSLKNDLEAGRVILNSSIEREFLEDLLRELAIPPSSQLLVFSSTSLQTSLISAVNPRALYFNEEVYVGYIPRGRIEVIGLDPELGAIFYIFDIPRGVNAPAPVIERSTRCMNCHAGAETGRVPGLLVKSVIPGPNRGSLLGFRDQEIGHHVPYSDRFGGWYLTGSDGFTNHWANLTGRLVQGELIPIPVNLGTVDLERYPVPTSDMLAHLVHEHQTGFVNRVVEAAYRARTTLHRHDGSLGNDGAAELDHQARRLVRYLLFADEPPLPAGGIQPNSQYQEAFLKGRRTDREGRSLKDLELQTRLFKHRCSYMIYSPLVATLPGEMKRRLYVELQRALGPQAAPEFAYLPESERRQIREILRATLHDLPADW